MKRLIAAVVVGTAASAFAFPVFAQSTAPKKDPQLPTAEERAKNRDTVSSTASSATLTTKVKTALASDAGMSTMTSIDVDSDKGVVTLKGKVDSADMKKKAEEIAKKVDGVKSVKNELRVEAKKGS
jgi:hyperosmotically inducible periplasmic protein